MSNRNTYALLRDYDHGYWSLYLPRFGSVPVPIDRLPGGRWQYVRENRKERFKHRLERRREAIAERERRRVWLTFQKLAAVLFGIPVALAATAACWKFALFLVLS